MCRKVWREEDDVFHWIFIKIAVAAHVYELILRIRNIVDHLVTDDLAELVWHARLNGYCNWQEMVPAGRTNVAHFP